MQKRHGLALKMWMRYHFNDQTQSLTGLSRSCRASFKDLGHKLRHKFGKIHRQTNRYRVALQLKIVFFTIYSWKVMKTE
jgi:hypothetical protein